MPRPPLTVHRSPTGFVLHDPALTRLAGIGPIPLPFTPEADPDEVLAHLRRLNPHRLVELDDELGDEKLGFDPAPPPPSHLGTTAALPPRSRCREADRGAAHCAAAGTEQGTPAQRGGGPEAEVRPQAGEGVA